MRAGEHDALRLGVLPRLERARQLSVVESELDVKHIGAGRHACCSGVNISMRTFHEDQVYILTRHVGVSESFYTF